MGIIRNGICGTYVWELDDEKTLTIRPQDGKSGIVAKDEYGRWPWQPYCHIRKVVIEDGVKTGAYAAAMFAGMRDCTEFDVSELDVSSAENMRGMFEGCRSLTSVKGMEKWNVSKAADISGMFNGCSSLTDISSLEKWDV